MLKAATNALGVIILSVTLCGFEALSQEAPQAPKIQTEQQAQGPIQGQQETAPQRNTSPPGTSAIPNRNPSSAEQKNEGTAGQSGHENSEFWQVLGRSLKITDTLLVVFTFFLFAATVALWWSTRRLVNEAETTAKRQLRAYVGIEAFEIHLLGPNVIAGVTLKNFGQTPGYDFQTWTNIRIGTSNEEVFGERRPPEQKSIIGPGTTFNAPSDRISVSKPERDAIEARQKVILVWSEASYRDAFGAQWVFRFRGRAMGPATERKNLDGRIVFTGWGAVPAGYEEVQAVQHSEGATQPS